VYVVGYWGRTFGKLVGSLAIAASATFSDEAANSSFELVLEEPGGEVVGDRVEASSTWADDVLVFSAAPS